MADQLDLKIVTPDGVMYNSEADKATIPTKSGGITVYPSHIPLVSVLEPGEIVVHKEDYTVNMAVSTGVLEVRPESKLYILADTAERAKNIDVEKAKQARQRAKELLEKKKNQEDVDFTKIQSRIEKEAARIRVGKKYRDVGKTSK
ncbi:MAG: ATP synthase F1 subunit epsilon [Candidatus Magasanikbacteria bacterium]